MRMILDGYHWTQADKDKSWSYEYVPFKSPTWIYQSTLFLSLFSSLSLSRYIPLSYPLTPSPLPLSLLTSHSLWLSLTLSLFKISNITTSYEILNSMLKSKFSLAANTHSDQYALYVAVKMFADSGKGAAQKRYERVCLSVCVYVCAYSCVCFDICIYVRMYVCVDVSAIIVWMCNYTTVNDFKIEISRAFKFHLSNIPSNTMLSGSAMTIYCRTSAWWKSVRYKKIY